MWPFRRNATRYEIMGFKRVTINGMKFVIRRLNPLLDFPEDKIPQIFTSYISRRPARDKPEPEPTVAALLKAQQDMHAVIEAGVVEPKIAKEGAEGICASDMFRDPTMGPKLYIEIISHSLNTFKGLRGVFFFHRIKLSLWIAWLKGMGEHRRKSYSRTAESA